MIPGLKIIKNFFSVSRLNILANFAGNGWAAIVGLVFSPIYIGLMGVEAYGLIGFSLLIYALALTCDFGFSRTIIKLAAASRVNVEAVSELPVTIKTIEVVYWAIGFLISLVILLSSEFVATTWLKLSNLEHQQAIAAIALISVGFLFQWPVAIYTAVFQGLEKHVQLNLILIISNTLKHALGVLVLVFYSASIDCLFVSYAFTSLLTVIFLRVKSWQLVRQNDLTSKPKIKFSSIKKFWRFSAGVFGTQLLSVAITQSDKVVVSSLLSLEVFGYYSIANSVASLMPLITKPFSSTFFPKFTTLVESKDTASLRSSYFRASELAASVLLPFAFVLALYSEEILNYWLHNSEVAKNSSDVLSFLIVAAAMNGLVALPYSLQLAYGITKLSFYQNLVSLAVQIPLIFYCVHQFGLIGAVIPRLLHNFSYLILMIPLMHKRVLKNDLWSWYYHAVLRPFFVVGGIVSIVIFLASIVRFPDWGAIVASILISLAVILSLRSRSII